MLCAQKVSRSPIPSTIGILDISIGGAVQSLYSQYCCLGYTADAISMGLDRDIFPIGITGRFDR